MGSAENEGTFCNNWVLELSSSVGEQEEEVVGVGVNYTLSQAGDEEVEEWRADN